jgi:thiamine biosynthesis lipoprotein
MNKFIRYLNTWVIICLPIFLCSCKADDPPQLVKESRPLLHTFVEIKAWGEHAGPAIEDAFHEMERVNALLNHYDPESEVSKINKQAGAGAVRISPDTLQALKAAVKFGDLSGGAFDFTIGPLLKLWGFAKDEAGLSGNEPDGKALKKAQDLVDYRALELISKEKAGRVLRSARLKKKGMWIDTGAFSKGFVSDRAMEVLKNKGIQNALIAAGGTICAIGNKPDSSPWKVGIRHPRKDDSFLTIISLKDRTVSTSGDYEKFYNKNGKRRTHIIDPRTGMPVEQMQAVTVIAPTGVESDVLSTALFVLGPQEGIKLVDSLPNVEALIVTHAAGIVLSKGWPQKTIIY